MTTTVHTEARPNVQEMVVVHRFFRRELTALPALVRGVADGDRTRAQVVGDHVSLVLETLHHHHTGEDELIWPLLLERTQPDADLIHTMEAQHAVVDDAITRAEPALAAWLEHPTCPRAAALASILDLMGPALVEHLDLEEREILPLIATHLSAAEWEALAEHGKNATARQHLPLVFGAFLEEASPEEAAMMLAPVPAPIRFFLRTAGARQYRRYITRVRAA